MTKLVSAAAMLAGSTALAMPRAITGLGIRAENTDPKTMIEALNRAFEEFKAKNDQTVGAKADSAELKEEIGKISASMDALEKSIDEQSAKIAAAQLNGNAGNGRKVDDPEYTKLFSSFMRDGTREQEELLKSEQRKGVRAAMSEGSNADGGYTTPIEWDRTVSERLKLISPIREEADVMTISTAGFTKLFTDRTVGSGWVGETASRPATSTPQFTSLAFAPGEIYANAAASQQLLDDSLIDIETWLTGEIEIEFARQEGIAFISGDGTNKPFGLLTYVTGAAQAARHPWGDIKLINSLHASQVTTDGVMDLIYALPAMYTPNAKFFLNRKSLRNVRKLKDGQGNYIWQPTFVAGQPSTLAGYAVKDTPDLPDVAANAVGAILFGDMRETYLIVDRIGFRVLRDPYTNKPYICFYCTKRVGGGVKNPDSMKAMQIVVTANS